jgi:hypothetical protein
LLPRLTGLRPSWPELAIARDVGGGSMVICHGVVNFLVISVEEVMQRCERNAARSSPPLVRGLPIAGAA